MRGLIFDIKEMALNDGAGVRTTVFFKGCPLRCVWCHNPEGLSPKQELYQKIGCLECGLCKRGCSHRECKPFGRCLHICPADLITVAGRYYTPQQLAEKLLSKRGALNFLSGGVTLSGGEPLFQGEFCRELISLLRGEVSVAIETSGYADADVFQSVAKLCDFIYMDIKLYDGAEHKRYTGVDNRKILNNAAWLMKSDLKYCFRVPLIPGITDTVSNLRSISEFVKDSPVELLPYNALAGAKYKSVGLEFYQDIDQSKKQENPLAFFENAILRK